MYWNEICIYIFNISKQIMDTFDDRSHTSSANQFIKPDPEDIASIKTKTKGRKGVGQRDDSEGK